MKNGGGPRRRRRSRVLRATRMRSLFMGPPPSGMLVLHTWLASERAIGTIANALLTC